MAGRNANSTQYEVKGSGKKPYTVTINYDTGHWCTCRGMISMKSTYQEDAGRTRGTSCKHVKETIKNRYDNDWGTKVKGGGGRRTPASSAPVSTPTTPAQPTGRRAAIMAQRARRERETTGRRAAITAQKANRESSKLPLLDRIDALAAAREGVTS